MKTKTEKIEKFVDNLISEDEQAMLLVGASGPDTDDKEPQNKDCTNGFICDGGSNSGTCVNSIICY